MPAPSQAQPRLHMSPSAAWQPFSRFNAFTFSHDRHISHGNASSHPRAYPSFYPLLLGGPALRKRFTSPTAWHRWYHAFLYTTSMPSNLLLLAWNPRHGMRMVD